MPNKLFVAPIINTMGPVTDARHHDLLNTWEKVDLATEKYFTDDFRRSLLDSQGRGVVLSWFPISWSGFDSNPVYRDFGWFTIYDHLIQKWGGKISSYGDGVYWMYNHPDKSGVGNVWGLDWLHNCHYLDILNRMVLERGYFPGVVEMPAADTHSVNFVEHYFPFELSNRSSPQMNWENIEADGKKTKDVLQWADAPINWIPYQPASINHQVSGSMKHHIFRLLDINTRIMTFPEEEVVSAFESCNQGNDVIIAGYEHDFRDRCDVVRELFLEPIKKIAKKYKNVEVTNENFQQAARKCTGKQIVQYAPQFTLRINKGYVCIQSSVELFGLTPYVAVKNMVTGVTMHVNPTPNGYLSWAIQRGLLPDSFFIGIAGFSKAGLQSVLQLEVNADKIILSPKKLSKTIPFCNGKDC